MVLIGMFVVVVSVVTYLIVTDRRNHKIKRTFYPKEPNYNWMKITEVPGTGKVIID